MENNNCDICLPISIFLVAKRHTLWEISKFINPSVKCVIDVIGIIIALLRIFWSYPSPCNFKRQQCFFKNLTGRATRKLDQTITN